MKSTIKFTAPVIKKDEEVPDEDQMKSQEELNATKTSISIADVKGNDEEHGADIADLKQVVVQAKEEPEQVFDMASSRSRKCSSTLLRTTFIVLLTSPFCSVNASSTMATDGVSA